MVKLIADPRHRFNKNEIRESAQKLLTSFGFSADYTLNIIFVGARKMSQIAKKYKSSKKAHPVLSFSYLDKSLEDKIIGEIFVCYPQAVLLAAERQRGVDDTIKSLIQHGINTIVA